MCKARYKTPSVPGFGLRPRWSVLTRLIDFRACKETEWVRISLLNLITFLCEFPKVTKEAGEETVNWALAGQPWWAEGWVQKQTACRDHRETFKHASLPKMEYMRAGKWVNNIQGLAGSRTDFLFPLLLSSSVEAISLYIQSVTTSSHPSTSGPPTLLLGHWDQLKFLFLPALSRNLILSDMWPACTWSWQTWSSQWTPISISAPSLSGWRGVGEDAGGEWGWRKKTSNNSSRRVTISV